MFVFFFKHKTAYEMRMSDCSSDVCSSDLQMSHAVTFKKHGNFQSGSRHRFEIIGPVEPGGAIEVRGPDLLQRFKEITGGSFRSIEHQMFEKMRKACLALGFVLRSDIIPDRNRNDGRLSVLMHNNA